MLSVLVSQLYILTDYDSTFPNGSQPLSTDLTFKSVGKPLATALAAGAIIIAVVGGVRYMRQQRAILNGKVYSGGMDFLVMFGVGVGVSL
jgi:hypothetical protein